MPASYPFSLISLQGRHFEGPVSSVVAPGEQGSFGLLSGHAQMVAGLEPGIVEFTTEEGTQFYVISGGVCEVRSHQTIILTQKVEKAGSKDEAKKILAETYTTA